MHNKLHFRSQLSEEERFHDRMVEDHDTRGGYFYEWGLSAEAVEYARHLLGEIRGKQVLDLGCGTGNETIRMAEQGAVVTAIDISARMVDSTQECANRLGLGSQVKAMKMSGEELLFGEETFDLIYGISVIHHLVMEVAAPQIKRVLKPGGKAVFVEPLDYNPLINLFRLLTPQRRSKTEKPLTFGQIHELGKGYSRIETREFNLANILAIAFPWRPAFKVVLKTTTAIDHQLLKFPCLRRFCWISVIELQK